MIGKCRLCQKEGVELKDSHIVSKLFYNELKRKSYTGIMRTAENPNIAQQDGEKTPFLCENCEELFSKYETYFSNNVYMPTINNGGRLSFDSRDDSIMYFLLSLAWRAELYGREKDQSLSEKEIESRNEASHRGSYTEQEIERIHSTLNYWRDILYAENMCEVRKVQQFIIPTIDLKFFENMKIRITDNVMMDSMTLDKENEFKFAFTCIQVPYYIFITTLWGETKSMKQFRVGKMIKPHNSELPKCVNNILISNHGYRFFDADSRLSDAQRKKSTERVGKAIKQSK